MAKDTCRLESEMRCDAMRCAAKAEPSRVGRIAETMGQGRRGKRKGNPERERTTRRDRREDDPISGVWCTRSPAHLVRCRDALSSPIAQDHPAHYAPTAQGLIADSGYLLYLDSALESLCIAVCRAPCTPRFSNGEGHRER